MDNEDPFTDSETRDSKIVLSEDSHLHGSQKRIFLPHQGVVCSTPRLEKPKDVSPIKEDLLSSTFESSDIDDDFIAAMEAAESTCPQRTASTPKMRMNTEDIAGGTAHEVVCREHRLKLQRNSRHVHISKLHYKALLL